MTARTLALEALKACTIYACAGGDGAMKNRHLAAIAALEAETGEPQGWKLVPVEPTQQMIRAYDPSGSMAGASWGKRQWLAMIAAAPKAPK